MNMESDAVRFMNKARGGYAYQLFTTFFIRPMRSDTLLNSSKMGILLVFSWFFNKKGL
jgi:hypothetical protein